MQNRIEFLTTNFPKNCTIPEEFQNLVFENNLHIICKSLSYRKLAKKVAINLVYNYLENPVVKYPPVYITKDTFLPEWRLFLNGFESLISKWQKASIIIFDGVDEIAYSKDLAGIASFISPFFGKVPLILISAGNLTEDIFRKYNALSFGVLLSEIKELVIGE